MNKCVKTAELFSCEVPYLRDFFSAHEYPWQMLPEIKKLAKKLISEGIEGFTEIKAGVLVGRSVKIHESAIYPRQCDNRRKLRHRQFKRAEKLHPAFARAGAAL